MRRFIPPSQLQVAAFFALTLVLPGRMVSAAESLPPGFRECATHADRDERLACFDAEVARLSSPAVKEQNFGTDAGSLARQKAAQRTDKFEEITARVSSIVTRPRGELVVTLDNGQIWSQTQTSAPFALQEGDSVKIKTGAMSAYLLIAPSGRTTRVTRIK
jgi:hypothetical protein